MPNVQDNKYAATQWGGEVLEDLTVPSGQLCQVRRPGVQGLIEAGIIHSLDSLTGIVQNELIPTAEGKQKVDVKKVLDNPDALVNILHLTDRVAVHVVVQPKVEMAPNDVTLRKPGVIYADMLDIQDKMFILNYALGGTRDLETFRKESSALVGSVEPEQES